MKIGGQRELIVPPSLGYGANAYQSIPANSVLVFLITAVSKK
jgi:FKBP-type peptidyl-prolyl cis-trans isomerase